MSSNSQCPIGVFDSGLGGLTLLKELMKAFPSENFIYLGDTARVPYGNRSPETIQKYLVRSLEALKKQNVKALVVACNSASTVLLEKDLWEKGSIFSVGTESSPRHSLPIWEVITAGAKSALEKSSGGRIGVIGTRTTINSKAYSKTIHSFNPAVQVNEIPCPLLVPLAEEGLYEDPVTNLIIYRYLEPYKGSFDTLILGCTHYPLFRNAIQKVVGQQVKLVDSSEFTIRELKAAFDKGEIPASDRNLASSTPSLTVLVTDRSKLFEKLAQIFLHPFEADVFEHIDL